VLHIPKTKPERAFKSYPGSSIQRSRRLTPPSYGCGFGFLDDADCPKYPRRGSSEERHGVGEWPKSWTIPIALISGLAR
jgi:hypothetical protein